VGAVLEGGYALSALARSVAATMAVLGSSDAATSLASTPPVPVASLSQRALERLAAFWPELG
jgi:acetoin utilization deacetylase AcuC-like enzyme